MKIECECRRLMRLGNWYRCSERFISGIVMLFGKASFVFLSSMTVLLADYHVENVHIV